MKALIKVKARRTIKVNKRSTLGDWQVSFQLLHTGPSKRGNESDKNAVPYLQLQAHMEGKFQELPKFFFFFKR